MNPDLKTSSYSDKLDIYESQADCGMIRMQGFKSCFTLPPGLNHSTLQSFPMKRPLQNCEATGGGCSSLRLPFSCLSSSEHLKVTLKEIKEEGIFDIFVWLWYQVMVASWNKTGSIHSSPISGIVSER